MAIPTESKAKGTVFKNISPGGGQTNIQDYLSTK